jgi:2-polyprenyl-6-methoxyphenol hydroxylase-like FAD-dependent oxidoreductase
MADTAVLIVGAGPVGLVAAARLHAAGVDCLVLEAAPEPPNDLRASTFHPPTLEMLDEFGFADGLIAAGLISPTWQVRMHETGERALFDLSVLAHDTRYPFRLQCEQRILCAQIEAALDGRVELRRGCEVVGVEQDEAGVAVTLRDGRRVTARYLVGADGARSIVRQAMGFAFDGSTYPETTILATTRFPFHEHVEGLSNVNYCWSAHGTFSLLRLPDLWRCSLYADAGESLDDALHADSIETKLQRIVPQPERYEVPEVRPYRIHQRIVESYRKGRVLLAGDAAHLNSPSGGMGMNGGIHDAVNLTDKLARVLRGGDERLLDLYSRQRQPIAKEQILAQAHRNRTRMQERDPERRREELRRLQAIAADPALAREHLLRSSMIEGLRQAEAIA